MELLEGETLAEFLRRQPRLISTMHGRLPCRWPRASEPRTPPEFCTGISSPATFCWFREKSPERTCAPSSQISAWHCVRTKNSIAAASVTGTGEVLGTPAYMSPEQVEGKELTPASDVYSLGLVLYQMATGTRAFEDATPLSMAVRRIKEDPVPPRMIGPRPRPATGSRSF